MSYGRYNLPNSSLNTQHSQDWWARGPCLPAVRPPVPTALQRFTTRFGMGRGGSTAPDTRLWFKSEGSCLCPSLACRTDCSMMDTRSPPSRPASLVAGQGSPRPCALVTSTPRGASSTSRFPGNLPGDLPALGCEMSLFGCISHLDAVSGSCCRP